MSKKKKSPMTTAELTELSGPFYDILLKEGDLQCTVIGASFIDTCLASLLHKYFVDCQTTTEIIHYTGPLGELFAKARLARCLGLISSDALKDIQTICEIRNKFAHEALGSSFSDIETIHLCDALARNIGHKVIASFMSHLGESAPRAKYIVRVSLLVGDLLSITEETPRSTQQTRSRDNWTAQEWKEWAVALINHGLANLEVKTESKGEDG